MQTMHTTSHTTIQATSQQLMMLHRHIKELQRVTDSQSQQITIMQNQLQQYLSLNTQLKNRNQQLELKCSSFKSSEQKIALVKDALSRDFNKLKNKILEQEKANDKLERIVASLKQELKSREMTTLQLCFTKEHGEKQLTKLHHQLASYKKENEQLLLQIRELKISAINHKIQSLSTERPYVGFRQEGKKKKGKERSDLIYIPHSFSFAKRSSSSKNNSLNNRSRNSGKKTVKKNKSILAFDQRYNMSEFIQNMSYENE